MMSSFFVPVVEGAYEIYLEQLILSLHTHTSLTDIENMPVWERKLHIENLIRYKKEEKERIEGEEKDSIFRKPFAGETLGVDKFDALGGGAGKHYRDRYMKAQESQQQNLSFQEKQELRKKVLQKADAVLSSLKKKNSTQENN